jgi:hypothetical protein
MRDPQACGEVFVTVEARDGKGATGGDKAAALEDQTLQSSPRGCGSAWGLQVRPRICAVGTMHA